MSDSSIPQNGAGPRPANSRILTPCNGPMSAVLLRPVDVNLSSFDRIVEEPPAIDRQFEPAQSWLNSQSVRLGLSRQCCRTIIWSGEFDYEQCAPITGSSPSAAPDRKSTRLNSSH